MRFRSFLHGSGLAVMLCGLAAPLVACGSLSSTTGNDSTLATIHGTITQVPSTPTPSDLSVAILWLKPNPAGFQNHEAAVSVRVTPSFPSDFTVDLTEPPPADVLYDPGDHPGGTKTGVVMAQGFVVAYDDRNHNGKLDLVESTATAYVDQIVGLPASPGLAVIEYFAAPPPPQASDWSFPGYEIVDGSAPTAGYNLAFAQFNVCGSDAGDLCPFRLSWKPIDTPITIPVGAASAESAADMNVLMCADNEQTTTWHSGCQDSSCVESVADFAGPLPSADDLHVTCRSPNTFSYSENCTTEIPNLCSVVHHCTEVFVSLDPPGGPAIPAPADWPCKAQ